jgi:hypothetical protein
MAPYPTVYIHEFYSEKLDLTISLAAQKKSLLVAELKGLNAHRYPLQNRQKQIDPPAIP